MRTAVCGMVAVVFSFAAGLPYEMVARGQVKVKDLRTRKNGTDWPRFLGPTGDSKSTEKGILTKWPEAGPRVVWKRDLGVGYAPPTISRGRLFTFSRFEREDGPRGAGDCRLTCSNAETGKELWKFEYPTEYEDYFGYNNGPRCCPVVDDDRVYIYGPEGMLHCISILTGKPIWRVDTFKKFNVVKNFFGVAGAPLVEGDLLITIVGGSPADQGPVGLELDRVKPNGSAIVAFNKHTGVVKYTIADELAGYASPVAATIDGRRWCFVFARGGLVGFEPAKGSIDFHFPWRAKSLECVNASNPLVVGDRVLISECYGPGGALLKVKPGGYDVLWSDESKRRTKSLQAHWNTPIHHEGYVYGCSGRHTVGSDLRCVELATGKLMWETDGRKEEDDPVMGRSSLLYADGHFICLTEFGELSLLRANPKKHDEVAHVVLRDLDGVRRPGFGLPPLLEYPAWAAPVLSHGLLYVRGKDRLVCLELIAEKGE